ncbi:MAG: sensor histidine kinase [Magnetovibrionaceae bacterium]
MALIAFGLGLSQTFSQINDGWSRYSAQAASINQALARVGSELGYGGFIHNFKNFVLRGDPIYRAELHDDLARLETSLGQLEVHLESETDQRDLEIIRKTVEIYGAQVSRISQMLNNGTSIQAIDQAVRVDDTEAFAALSRLREAQFKRSQEIRRRTEAELLEAKQFLSIGILVVLGAAIAILAIITLLRSTTRLVTELDIMFLEAPDAMLRVRSSGEIEKVNKQAERLFGYSADELVGMHLENLVPERARIQHAAYRQEYIKAPTFRPMASRQMVKGLTKTGEEPSLSISLSHTGQGEDIRAIAAIRDISNQLKMQQAVEAANASAHSAVESKARLLSNIGHELRTPLNQIIGFAEFLLHHPQEKPTEAQEESLNHIADAGRHQLSLVDRILAIVDGHGQGPGCGPEADQDTGSDFDPVVLVQQVMDDHAAKAADKGIELSLVLGKEPPGQRAGDRSMVKESLSEVLSNAIAYMDHSDGKVQVILDQNGSDLRIVIEDNGPGIPAPDRERVFEPFERLDAERRAIGGIGLGLTIAKYTVDSMGGEIRIEPAQKGTRVVINLPGTEGPAETASPSDG